MAGLVVFTAQASRLLPPQDDPVPRFQRRKALAWSEDTVGCECVWRDELGPEGLGRNA